MDKQLRKSATRRYLGKKCTSIYIAKHSKKYQIGKRQAMMAYMDTGLKDSLSSTKDWPSKWIDALKKEIYMNG